MVERTESKEFSEFEGTVEQVEEVDSKLKDNSKQYKLSLKTQISSTGYMYEWINIPETAKGDSVPEGSNLDKYLIEVEMLHSEVKEISTVTDALKFLVGKTYLFKKKKLGKSYKGQEAKEFWVPVKEIQ